MSLGFKKSALNDYLPPIRTRFAMNSSRVGPRQKAPWTPISSLRAADGVVEDFNDVFVASHRSLG
jgi:hypothetical protein